MSDCRFGVSPVNYPDPDPDPDAMYEGIYVSKKRLILANFPNTACLKSCYFINTI